MVTIDKDRIKQAIQKAERRTSGEIRVSVSPLFWGDVRKAAEKAFERLGMTAAGATAIVQGFGNVGSVSAMALAERGVANPQLGILSAFVSDQRRESARAKRLEK